MTSARVTVSAAGGAGLKKRRLCTIASTSCMRVFVAVTVTTRSTKYGDRRNQMRIGAFHGGGCALTKVVVYAGCPATCVSAPRSFLPIGPAGYVDANVLRSAAP